MRNDQPVIMMDDEIEFANETRCGKVGPSDTELGKNAASLLPIATVVDIAGAHTDSH